jgi:hypothetical protein
LTPSLANPTLSTRSQLLLLLNLIAKSWEATFASLQSIFVGKQMKIFQVELLEKLKGVIGRVNKLEPR